MRHLRIFDSVSDMETAIASSEIDIMGLAYENGQPVMYCMGITPPTPPTPPAPDYSIPFYIDVRGTLELDDPENLLMSTDGETWTEISVTELSTGRTYFRVASDLEEPQLLYYTEDENSDYDIGGNINSLVTVDFENDTTCYPFDSAFGERAKLKSAGNLILPATTLSSQCYQEMFYGCESLTTAPALPATTLAEGCYSSMFRGCTSLTSAPALPATTLAVECYNAMFYGCESLTAAPALPATTLADYCYANMFTGCTSLTSAPATLPATTLGDNCYEEMFAGCTSLATAPALPATTLAGGCYLNMFNGCTSLTVSSVSNIGLENATTLAESCYDNMFYGIDNGQEMSESDYWGWCNSHLPQGYNKNIHGTLFIYIPSPI